MTEQLLSAIIWLIVTLCLSAVFYHLILWIIPYYISYTTFKRMQKAGRKKNVLVFRELNNADNCVIPEAIADSVMSGCYYDLTKTPLRITSCMPDDSYWSMSFYAYNTDNFFVINDLEVKEKYGDSVTVVLVGPGQRYTPREDEVLVRSPSRSGYIIVRMMVTDTKDPEAIRRVTEVQRRALAEEVNMVDEVGEKVLAQFEYPASVFVKALPSIEALQAWVQAEYNQNLPFDLLTRPDPIELPGGIQLSVRRESTVI